MKLAPVGLTLLVACGPAATTRPTNPTRAAGARPREVATPRVCLGKRRLLEALGKRELAAEAARPSERIEREPAAARSPAPPIESAYDGAAPATVLIKTRDGMGSGVVIDGARGLVLTNHHVIDDLLREDLTVHVTLELGKALPAGRIVAAGTRLEGIVVKADPVKDLAIVKIQDPPAGLASVRVSEYDPRVGETVMSIGNAGIGLSWAAKVCNVSKVGDATRETSMLEIGDCTRDDLTATDKDRRRHREQCEARREEIKKRIEQSPQGLSVQTTCSINGGDSGGPLVNAWGELVGLNQSVRFGANTLAFHVHVAEIRELVRELSDTPVALVPDPFCRSGAEVKLEDLDGDGAIDTSSAAGLAFSSGEMMRQGAYLFDLDQDAAARATIERPFDPEIALILDGDDAFAFYDTDGDGELDVLFRDDKADGSVERAYRLAGGTATLDRSLLGKRTLDPAVLGGAHLERLGAAVAALGVPKLTTRDALAAAEVPAVPDALRVFGEEGFAQDADGDGKAEVIFAHGGTGMAMLLDVRSPALASLKSGDTAAPALKSGTLRPQYVYLDRPSGNWALYDTDGQDGFDLALYARKPQLPGMERYLSASFVTHAFRLAPGKPPEPVTEPLGRSLGRADLFADPKVRRGVEQGGVGRGTGRGGLPDPTDGANGQAEAWKLAGLDRDRQVLEQVSRVGHVVLVDLDRDTKKLATRSAAELAQGKELDAELAIVRDGELGWFFYDTDRDGVYDLVTHTRDFATLRADNVLRLDPTGERVTTLPAGGTAYRPELVRPSAKQRAALDETVARMKLSLVEMQQRAADPE